jgi:hypothetical protein
VGGGVLRAGVASLSSILRRYYISAGARHDAGGGGFGAAVLLGVYRGLVCYT